jgi:Domain of unknown function (DUF4157)
VRVVGQAHGEVREPARARGGGGLESQRSGLAPGAAVPAQARLLLFFQESAGNRAVSGLVQRSRDPSEHAGFAPVQREGTEEEERLQARFATAQRQGSEDEELQIKQTVSAPVQLQPDPVPPRNDTGLPDGLKSGIESLSGMSLDYVKVHYNSAQPAQLNALAYAQGSDIHVAPGQEQHLPHESWHLIQQAQGRVQPSVEIKDGVPVNDDEGLEYEADVMGAKAAAVRQVAVPLGLFQRRTERAVDQTQRKPVSGLNEKGPLNFLSSDTTGSPGGLLAEQWAASARAVPQPTRLRAGFGRAVLQREVTGQTQIDWKANAADLTGSGRRKKAFREITNMINDVLWHPGNVLYTKQLTDALQKLRADAHYAKYVGAIDAVLNDLAGDAPMGYKAVQAYVDQNQAALFPPGAGDLADQAVLALRKSILINKLVEQQQTVNGVYQNAAGLAARGVQGGQWVGRGLCQEAAQAGGAHAEEITPDADRSSIDWNHYINRDGLVWRDRTWKQFFNLADTAGVPPIFQGDAADFRALGLPQADTDRYLAFLGK